MKKSFIIHKDMLSILDDLTDEQAGQLFKCIKTYQDGEEMELPILIKIAFAPFKASFDRDAEKYEAVVERNRKNGAQGGRPKVVIDKTQKNPKEPKKPSGLSENPKEPKKPDNDNVNKNVNDNDNKKDNVNEKENDKSEASSQDRENRLNSFEEFWSRYDYKKEKPKAIACWLKLKDTDIVQIFKIVDAYVKSTPDKKYRMHPTTYLNPKNRRWEDEIVKPAAKFTAGEKTYKNEDHYSEADDKKWQEEIKKNGYDASTW